MSLGVSPTPFSPLSNRVGTNPRFSLSFSFSLEPIPASTRTFLPHAWRSRQFSPSVIRFLRSVVTLFSQVEKINKIVLIGNLGRDPEVRYTPSGQTVTSFSVATNHRYKTASGEPTVLRGSF